MSATPPITLSCIKLRIKVAVSRFLPFVSLCVLLGTTPVMYFGCGSKSPAREAIALMVEAFNSRRLIEPRVSGGFRAAHYDPGLDNQAGVDQSKIRNARDILSIAVADGSDPHAEAALGRLLLVSGEAKEPKTLELLQRVAEINPQSAEAHNDLAVYLLETDRLIDALDELNKALKLSPTMPEALFNRALCYEKLLLYMPAVKDLESFSRVEHDGGWLAESTAKQEKLNSEPPVAKVEEVVLALDTAVADGNEEELRRIVAQNYEALRRPALMNWPLEFLTASWEGDDVTASRAMLRMKSVGRASEQVLDDRQFSDLASFLSGLDSKGVLVQKPLVEGYADASKTYNAQKFAETLDKAEALLPKFKASRNMVFASMSMFLISNCLFEQTRVDEYLRSIISTATMAQSRGWRYSYATNLMLLGAGHARLGRDSLALKELETARSMFNGLSEFERKILQLEYYPYVHLGDFDAAARVQRDSLRTYLTRPSIGFQRTNMAYNYNRLADLWAERNRDDVAALYAEASVDCAVRAKYDPYIAGFSAQLALELARLGDIDGAEKALEDAMQALGRIPASQRRSVTESEVRQLEGETALLMGASEVAIDRFTKAEELARLDTKNPALLVQAIRGRAGAYAKAGQTEKASASISEALKLIEEYPDNFDTSEQRNNFLGASQGAFDLAISLFAKRSRPDDAFEATERSRARALLGQLSLSGGLSKPGAVNPLDASSVARLLPSNVAVVSYAITEDRSYAFVITKDGLLKAESSATTAQLAEMVNNYVRLLKEKAAVERINPLAQELYRLLIEPVASSLPKEAVVCIVPDKSLHYLPFAALRDSSGQYFVQSHPLCYAPSASMLAACLRQHAARASRPAEKVLAVGNPSYNPELKLSDLPEAKREAEDVARLFGNQAVTLTGSNATEPAVCAAMRDCDVIHIASHSLVRENSPWLAAFALADGTPHESAIVGEDGAARAGGGPNPGPSTTVVDGSDGLLYLDEVYRLRLPRTRLVVLSSCESALGQYYRGEGMVSLARPFLAAGVPTVVASLWPVDSAATAPLMVSFHRERKAAGNHTAEGLRTAQMKMFADPIYSHPFYWAAFLVAGAP